MSGQPDLARLGWSSFFADQIGADEAQLVPRRIASVHRSRLTAVDGGANASITLPVHSNTGEFAVGDWVLVDPQTGALHRRLDRRTVLERRVADGSTQLAGANIDTLFVVTSCNADFSIARLERYLALANQAGTTPVIVLTKADLAPDTEMYRRQAAALQRGLPVVVLNAKMPDAAALLAEWCGGGQTVALVGSSGVGKSTLVNTLCGNQREDAQQTGDIREHDAKGRHTTTARSLHRVIGGGWVMDTPGMRSLQVGEVAHGLDVLFAEISELAPLCRFRDCTHAHEPGCAVQSAIAAGTLDPERLLRWRKLRDESHGNAPVHPKASAGRSRRS